MSMHFIVKDCPTCGSPHPGDTAECSSCFSQLDWFCKQHKRWLQGKASCPACQEQEAREARVKAEAAEREARRRAEEAERDARRRAEEREREAKLRAEKEKIESQLRADEAKREIQRRLERERRWRQVKTAAPYVASLVLVLFGISWWKQSADQAAKIKQLEDQRVAAVDELISKLTPLLEKGDFQRAIEIAHLAVDEVESDPKVQSIVKKAEDGRRTKKVDELVGELTAKLEKGDAENVVSIVNRQPKDIASDARIVPLFEAAKAELANKSRIDQLVADLIPLLEGGQYTSVIDKLSSVPADIKSSRQISGLSKRAFQGRSFETACNEISKNPFHQDVKPLEKQARDNAQLERERKRINELIMQWESGRAAEIGKHQRELATVAKEAAMVLDSARQFRPTSDDRLQELKNRISGVRSNFSKFGLPKVEVEAADMTIDSIAAWKTVANRFSKLEADVRGANADEETFAKIANHLSVEIGPSIPDSEVSARFDRAKSSLPRWKSVLRLQRSLHDGDAFKKTPKSDDWMGLPHSSAWPTGAKYLEMLRQRESTFKGTAASDLKEYLKRREIVDLWVFRQVGLEYSYYASKQPLPDGGTIQVLLDETAPFIDQQFAGNLKGIQKSPQSLFADRASALWLLPDKSKWNAEVANHYEDLLDSKNMEPLLKLSLIRKFLALATVTSAGYAESLKADAGYVAILGPTAMIQGNWLDPNKNLTKEREAAEEFISKAPHLNSMADDATTRDDQAFSVVKNGLGIPGHLSRDELGKLVLARFEDSPSLTNGRLFVVADGEWIEVGQVKSGSTVCNERAAQYFGWPVFSIRDNK